MTTRGLFANTWGMSAQEWESYRAQMRDMLVGIAASGATVTYGEISHLIFQGRFSARSTALTQMVSEVCVLEEERYPQIIFGSLVVRADSGIPGQGYFFDLRNEYDLDIDPADVARCRALWETEIKKVWLCYGAPEPMPPAQGVIDFG